MGLWHLFYLLILEHCANRSDWSITGLQICLGCVRDLLGIAAVKTLWKSVTILALGRESSTGLEQKEKEQSCCTSIFSLPFCINLKSGLLRVEGALPQSFLLMLCMIPKFMMLLDLGVMSLAYYRSSLKQSQSSKQI